MSSFLMLEILMGEGGVRKKWKNILLEAPIKERHRAIVIHRFGLNSEDDKIHTLKETGDVFGVSRQRVQKIEKDVLQQITTSFQK